MRFIKKYRIRLSRDFATCFGLSLLIVSPYFLEKVPYNSYFSFDIYDYFLIPHIQSILVLAGLIYAVNCLRLNYFFKPRWFLILISSLLLILFLRGLLSLLGFTPQSIAVKIEGLLLFSPGWVDHATIKRLTLLFSLALCLPIISLVNKDFSSLIRAYSAFGWVMGFISIFNAISVISVGDHYYNSKNSELREAISEKKIDKRVVWVIFDEMDYSRVFEKRYKGLTFKNLDGLRSQSVSADHAVSPAWSTAISVPALITGEFLLNTYVSGPGKLLLNKKNGTEIEWSKQSTLFSRMNAKGMAISVLGFYHPYCSIFSYLKPCFSQSVFAYPSWWWGIFQGGRAIPGLDHLLEKFRVSNDGYNQTTKLQLSELDAYLSSKSAQLSFIHLNFPHLPGSRDVNLNFHYESQELPGYEQNLLLVDYTVGKIVKRLELESKSQDILLIISSDHWLRTKQNFHNMSPELAKSEFGKDLYEVNKVPLLIRRMREKTSYRLSKPVNTIYTAQFIEDWLDEAVSDHISILSWWQRKDYISPILPKEAN